VTRFQWIAEITGIILSAVLVLASYLAFTYGGRKDKLTEQLHNDEIARIHLETAKATERAAKLEKEAANAHLEQEKLKAKVAWRNLTPIMEEQLSHVIRGTTHTIMIGYISSDAESAYFAMQLSKAFKTAGWNTLTQSQTYNCVILGVCVPDPPTPATILARQALTAAEIPFGIVVLPSPGMTTGSGGSGEATIIVGSKPQVF
jgi:hypothetical protein